MRRGHEHAQETDASEAPNGDALRRGARGGRGYRGRACAGAATWSAGERAGLFGGRGYVEGVHDREDEGGVEADPKLLMRELHDKAGRYVPEREP